jgi:hypothetical protein
MAIEDLRAFLVTGIIAAVIALPVAALARRSRKPYHVTAVWSFGIGMVGGPVYFGIAEAINQSIADGISFGRALEIIFSVAFLYFFAAPLFFGLPAILAGCAFQWLFRLGSRGEGNGSV